MKINFTEMQEIINTLPISLYTERKIPCRLDGKTETSYYDSKKDEIVISFSQVNETLANIDEEDYEMACRSVLYHEISHAILTPQYLSMTDVINTFEDERIETLLNDFYYGVDFTKTLFSMCKDSLSAEPTTALEKFFKVVRLKQGEKKWLDKVNELIAKYADLTRDDRSKVVAEYCDEINSLFEEICSEFPKSELKQAESGDNNGEISKSGESKGKGAGGAGEKGEGKSSSGDKGKSASGGEGETDGEGEKDKKDFSDKMSAAADNKAVGKSKCSRSMSKSSGTIGERNFKSVISRYEKEYKKKFYDTIQLLFNGYKKRSNSGGTAQSYSGIFNPRNVLRNDYKLFDRALNSKTGGHFGQFNLNLFLDCSGSFYKSEEELNAILRALKDLKHKNSNFTYTITVCGMGEKVIDDTDNFVYKASGGNDLDEDIYEIFRRLQKPNFNNYNIALFDGDAFSDSWGKSYEGKTFKAFDFSNSTIISDYDNERYICDTVKTARVIYTKNYCKDLEQNITKALQIALN